MMITVQNISKQYGTFEALKDISFRVGPGEVVGLLGANGAGKSTLLRILSTMLVPTSGNAILGGFELGKENDAIRGSVGILFGSDAGLYDELNGEENLRYFAALSQIPRGIIKQRIETLSNKLGFSQYLKKRADTLSKGMRQKLVFARSVIHDPPILLLDEPESGLDFLAAETVYEFILQCKHEGKAILFSSHSVNSIKRCADRVLMLKGGRLCADEPLRNDEFLGREQQLGALINAYIKEALV